MGFPAHASRDPYRDGLALAERGRHAEAIGCFESALKQRPNDGHVLFALGRTAEAIGHVAAAETFFRRVLEADPDRLEALVNLANLLRKRGRTADVIALLKPAIERNPEHPELWLTLGSSLREGQDIATAETFYREALRLKPNYAPALGNLADLLADRGAVDEALSLYQRALRCEPENAQARLNRAILFLMRGELKKGWEDYEYRLKIKERVIVADQGLPAWNGKDERKRLLVTAEQGVGDQIMFASVIPELAARFASAGGKVLFEAEPRLVPLFARSFPNVSLFPSKLETRGGITSAHYELARFGGAEASIALASLPRLLRKSLSAFPRPHSYLVPDSDECARWSQWFKSEGRGPFIGLCWRSGLSGGLRGSQYAPLTAWAEFIRSIGGTPVSLQYDLRSDELDELQRASGRTIVVPPMLDQKQELDRTASMIAALDTVVSAPTSVSWIAAALGKPTLKLLYNNSWTSFGESYEPFAPSCVCVMPKTSGNWGETFASAEALLSASLKRGAPPAP